MLELNDIARLRKQLGLTQPELAQLSGVSQSLIAKLEAGKIEPSYTKVKSIIDTLTKLRMRNSKRAGDISSANIHRVQADKIVQEAADIMHNEAISQLPVFESGRVVGSITEKTILKILSETRSPIDAFKKRISDVMDDPFPTVSDETPVELLYQLLTFFEAVLVTERNVVKGIVTKTDLLKIG